MRKIVLLICLITLSSNLFAQEEQTDTDLIRKALNNYIEGRNNGDTAQLASAFYREADLRFRNQQTGALTIWSLADYVNKFKPGQKLNCTAKIISVNIAGSAAQAKIEIYYPDRTYADYINLLKIGNKWAIASKIFSLYPVRKKVLFIVTSYEKLGNTGKKTGFHLGEVAQVYKPFYDAGYDIDFASPKGGKAYNYGADMNNETDVWFVQNVEATEKLFHTQKLTEVDPKVYEAVYFAGGHGVMWDLPNDKTAEKITRTIYENNGVIGAVCHGPAALTNVKLSNGQYLVQGKTLTSFTNLEEKEIKLDKTVPFLLQDQLQERGGKFKTNPNWQINVQADQRLVTGQNPASAQKLAETMIQLLSKEPRSNK